MHLSELTIVVKHLEAEAKGAIISNIYRSFGGTLIKFFGSKTKGLYFNTKKNVLFPVNDLSLYKKEPISRTEEGLRSNFKGKISHIHILEEYGKVIEISTFSVNLVVPLFGGNSIYISDRSGNIIWREKRILQLKPIEKPMEYIAPETENAVEFETLFFQKLKEKEILYKESFIKKRLSSLQKLKKKLEKQLDVYKEDSVKLFILAEALKANLYKIDGNSRKDSVRIIDLSGKESNIVLNPEITVIENLQSFYRRSAKFKKGIDAVKERLKTIDSEAKNLQDGNIEIDMSEHKVQKTKTKKEVHKEYHEYKSLSGRIFFVGKKAQDNDVLTFKIASPHDIWFHAKDQSGSHVIMKTGKNENISEDDIYNGALLALYYSKAKKTLKGEVWIAHRKNIIKRKGMPPGKVDIKKGEVKYISAEKMPETLKKI